MPNKSFQDRLRIVDSAQVGFPNRLQNTSQFHPMVRNNWGTSDRVRGVLGQYYSAIEPIDTSQGSLPGLPPQDLVNYSAVYSDPDAYKYVQDQNMDADLYGLTQGGNDGTNLIFDYSVQSADPTDLTSVYPSVLHLEFSQDGWGSAGYNIASNYSLYYFGGPPGSFAQAATPWIANNLSRYFGTSSNAVPGARVGGPLPSEISALLDQGLPLPGTPIEGILFDSNSTIYADHTTEFYLPSSNALVRQAAGDALAIESTYVQYVDSVPALETVVNNPSVPERLIPNAYYLQLELQNTTNVLLAEGRYAQSLTLDYNVPWFDSSTSVNQATENNKKRFYESYAQTLNTLIVGSQIQDVAGALESNQDVFVLHRDREVLDENAINPSTIPFYNKIIIPALGSEGRIEGVSGLEQLALTGNPDTIDMLQTQTIKALRTQIFSVPFDSNTRQVNNASDSTIATYTNTPNNQYPVVYDVEDLFDELKENGAGKYAPEIENDEPISNASSLHNRPPANAVIQSPIDPSATQTIPRIEINPDIIAEEEQFMSFGESVTRNYKQTLEGEFCHTETLLFVVKKFRVEETTDTLVQTFYFTNVFDKKEIVYYDSQIKTQQKYRYEIHRVVYVFGTEYEYVTTQFSGFEWLNPAATPAESQSPPGPAALAPAAGGLGPVAQSMGHNPYLQPYQPTQGPQTQGSYSTPSANANATPRSSMRGGPASVQPLSSTPSANANATPLSPLRGGPAQTTLYAPPPGPSSQTSTPPNLGPLANTPSSVGTNTAGNLPTPSAATPTDRRFVATLPVNHAPSMKALLIPHVIGGITTITQDKPPVSPNLSFYPFRGVNNRVKMLLQPSTGIQSEKPVALLEKDKEFFEEEYLAQTGIEKSYGQITELQFRSDDPVDLYQLFRLQSPPSSYEDFENYVTIDPRIGRAGSAMDIIRPNQKYYYCARSVDIHGNISNPTHVYELEMVDNGGQIFLRQRIFMFESIQPQYTKSGRRFIYIEPSLQQLALEPNADLGTPNINNPPNSSILGASGVEKVWNNTYKIRVTSKKTNRKLDLNVTFTNPGIVNPSE